MDAVGDDDEFSFRLVLSPSEPGKSTPEGQAGIAELTKALRDAGANPVTTGMAFDSADGGGFQLPEFTLLLKELAGPVSVIIAAWIHGAYGRKFVIKTDDYTVQAPTVEMAENLARTQQTVVDAAKKGRKKRKRRD